MLEFIRSQSLRGYNTFGFDVQADFFIEVHSQEEFQEILKSDVWRHHSRLIIGGGSNILLTEDFKGLVVVNRMAGTQVVQENDKSLVVECGGGETWHQFVLYTLRQGWGGLENLSLIPGTVGAAPMQNIGAYGVEIKRNFHSLEAIHLETGELKIFDADECEFGYRESVFKHKLKDQYLISSVSFRLTKPGYHQLHLDYGVIRNVLQEKGIAKPTIQEVSDAVIEIRQSKLPDPTKLGNSGSFFKNPIVSFEQYEAIKKSEPDVSAYPLDNGDVKLAAGWLIDKVGWKGYTENGVGVHHKQALVLVNYGTGSGKDILDLAKKIQSSIQTKFGIELNSEVNLIS